MKFYSAMLFAFMMSYFNANAQQMVPDYGNLETVVRLKATHGRDAGCSDYLGLSLMFETRDRLNKAPVWIADVAFGPEDHRTEVFYPAGAVSWTMSYNALVLMRYACISGYANEERRYGTEQGSIHDPQRRDLGYPLEKHWQPRHRKNVCDANGNITVRADSRPSHNLLHMDWSYERGGGREEYRKIFLHSSVFEWDLPNTLTISDLKSKTKDFADRTNYRYTLAGFSCRDNIINCCQFSCSFLNRLGINVSISDYIRKYVSNDYGVYGWPVVNFIPFAVTIGHSGSFRPEQVVEEILKNRRNIGGTHGVGATKIVTIRRPGSNIPEVHRALFKKLIRVEANGDLSHVRRESSWFSSEDIDRIALAERGDYNG